MTRVEMRYSSGAVDYKGITIEGTAPITRINVPDSIFELRVLIGAEVRAWETHPQSVYFYSGLGYRYLDDDASTFSSGYESESNYFYCPLGININMAPEAENGWSIGGAIEYDYLLRGMQASYLSDADIGYNNQTNIQKGGIGYRGSIRFQKKLEDASIHIQPFFKRWNIRKSDETPLTYNGSYIKETSAPANHSTEIGVTIGVTF
ncbi:MAG: hypothetical protein AB1599_06750 [Planctomycetota bacterium]